MGPINPTWEPPPRWPPRHRTTTKPSCARSRERVPNRTEPVRSSPRASSNGAGSVARSRVSVLSPSAQIPVWRLAPTSSSRRCTSAVASSEWPRMGPGAQADAVPERPPSGSSSVGRASASQAEGRGFETLLPLHLLRESRMSLGVVCDILLECWAQSRAPCSPVNLAAFKHGACVSCVLLPSSSNE